VRFGKFNGVQGVCEFVLDAEQGKCFWRLTAFIGRPRERRYPDLARLLNRETLAGQLRVQGLPIAQILFRDGQCWVYPEQSPHYAGRATDTLVAALARNYPQYGKLPMKWAAWNGQEI
jgi:hypothetical protein